MKKRSLKKEIRPTRIDQLLVLAGHVQSRERAKALIKAGHVLIDGKPIFKVATKCALGAKIEVTAKDIPWVSRAALKLEGALDRWPINITNATCLDIGASINRGFYRGSIASGGETSVCS